MQQQSYRLWIAAGAVFALASLAGAAEPNNSRTAPPRPNVILMMADDLGWGDVGFNGGKVIRTPELDAMAAGGLGFTRFYAAAPVCSPTRGSCLTGRHPFRYGVTFANSGRLKPPEISLAQLLREHGYTTGHFGKWHLGTLVEGYSGHGRSDPDEHATPGMNGFDEWFSTEFAVATWDPYDPANRHLRKAFDPRDLYWHNGKNVTEPQTGDDSRIIMDRAIPFIEGSVREGKAFFAVIWFHAPHSPVIGGPHYRAMYADHPEPAQHYYACVTAMDEQVGRLRRKLRELGVAENTMLWFCSDNGPARQGEARHVGSAGPFRGYKVSLYEGGVRVPGVLEWPARIKAGATTDVPAVTSDYLPTTLDVLGIKYPHDRPLDGVSLVPVIEGRAAERPSPIGFRSQDQLALSDNRYKLIRAQAKGEFELYDLIADPGESRDLAAEHPQIVQRMSAMLAGWVESVDRSAKGEDYR